MRKCYLTQSVFFVALLLMACGPAKTPMHTTAVGNENEMKAFFAFRNDSSIIISGHRGGMPNGYPENSIEAFEKTLESLPAFFEVDPRLTKDSVIVLMHDADISRTTTGTGLLASYTWKELQQFNLVDREGNVTPYHIPSLEEAIVWSKGKTVLNLDKKDVPLAMMADFLEKLNAPNVMLTVHNPAQALYYYQRNKNSMFSAFMRNMEEYKAFEEAGIPWSHFIAYVGPQLEAEKQAVYDLLHTHGVRCMISLAPNFDKVAPGTERKSLYQESIKSSPDIIETDFPIDLFQAWQGLE
jgi:glycerophosphoryl diester phosphodiesterase